MLTFSSMLLSFLVAMIERLRIPAEHEGIVWFHNSPRRKWWMHRHAELEINLVTAGTAHYLLGHGRYDLFPNSIVWLFPEQEHLLLDQSPDHCMWTLVVKPELLQRVCLGESRQILLAANPAGYFCRRLASDQAHWLATLLRDVSQAKADPVRYNAGLAYAVLSGWAAYLAAEESNVGTDVHPAVEKAAHLIREHREPMRMDDLALECGLSPSRLSKLFQEQTGMSLVSFRNRQRLERFLHLYGEGRRTSMLAAALDAGFGSYAQFYRVFAHLMGCTPAEYRRRHKAR